MQLKDKKILVTGGKGFLGSYVVKELLKRGISSRQIFAPSSKTADLRKRDVCSKVVKHMDIVIHAAGKIGGIGLNKEKPGELFYDNIIMGVQLMEAARRAGVKKFVSIGTVCAYPNITPIPFKEEELWNGYPEETNAPYGLAKKMLLVQGQAYKKQYNFNAIFLLPVNLYGPGDDFNPERSHVMPAMIKRVLDAKRGNKKFINVWGTGRATREFLYVEDAARALVLATEKYQSPNPVNIGSGMEISIKDLNELICRLLAYKGKIRWDNTKPDGQPRRCLDVSKAKKEFGFEATVNFHKGVKKTIEWYLQTQKN